MLDTVKVTPETGRRRSAIDVVLCDLDGVLRVWPPEPERRLERTYRLPAGAIAAAAFAPDRLRPAVTGQISDEQWRKQIAADLEGFCEQRASTLVEEWSRSAGHVDPVVLALLSHARKRVRVGLFTNATTRLHQDLARLHLTDAVDEVISSAELGLAKPEARAFALAAQRFGVPPSRCLFIDDRGTHVEVARRVGMVTHHYAGHAALNDALTQL